MNLLDMQLEKFMELVFQKVISLMLRWFKVNYFFLAQFCWKVQFLEGVSEGWIFKWFGNLNIGELFQII